MFAFAMHCGSQTKATEVSKDRKKNKARESNALYFQVPKGKRLIDDSGYKEVPKNLDNIL
mgnify:CR=1 FL=1|jgi:hypothetical protein